MSIWFRPISIEALTLLNQNTLSSLLGIEYIEIGENFLKAKMPVDSRTKQPYGIMHGGASCVLAESVASCAANFCVDSEKENCVGIEINTSHIHSISSGWVIATAKPLHLGKSTQAWEIPITNEKGALVSMNRLRLAILQKRK